MAELTDGVRLGTLITALQPDPRPPRLPWARSCATPRTPARRHRRNLRRGRRHRRRGRRLPRRPGRCPASWLRSWKRRTAGLGGAGPVLRRILDGERGEACWTAWTLSTPLLSARPSPGSAPPPGPPRAGAAMTALIPPGAAIAGLSDPDAIRVLAACRGLSGPVARPAELAGPSHPGCAKPSPTAPHLGGYGEPGGQDQETGSGDLARAALQHLAATRPGLIPVITRCHRARPGPAPARTGHPGRRGPGGPGLANRGQSQPRHPRAVGVHRAQAPGPRIHPRTGDQQTARRLPAGPKITSHARQRLPHRRLAAALPGRFHTRFLPTALIRCLRPTGKLR